MLSQAVVGQGLFRKSGLLAHKSRLKEFENSLSWLPETDAGNVKETEKPGGEVFSRVFTKARNSKMRSFPMDLSPGRRKGKSLSNGFLFRGLKKVEAEPQIICLTHNLLKLLRAGVCPQGA